MKLLNQLNIKNIISTKNPVCVLGLRFKRSFAANKYQACLAKFQFTVDVRNIYTDRKLYSNIFTPIELQNNAVSDEKGKIITVSPESADILYGFKAECSKQEQFLLNKLEIENNRSHEITDQEWDLIKNLVLELPGTINEKNIDAVIMNKCCELKFLTLGKLYFRYLKSSTKPINRATYGNYLRLFSSCECDCTSDDLNEILVVYRQLLEVYPILDSNTAEKVICALSITKEWKEYEKLFVTIKQFYNPSKYIYKIVILTAFHHQEFNLGWKLIDEMQHQGMNVPEEVFSCWFEKVKSRKLEGDLVRVLNFFNYFNVKPSNDLCQVIKDAYEEYNEKGRVTFTRIARSGECRSCRSKLEPCNISQEDFDELRKAFLNPVIIGKDIFQKTRPEEFKEFLEFLNKSPRFDVVIDGLNVAFLSGKRSANESTYLLKSVVKHFATLGKSVVVLGRKHMAKTKTPNIEYVYQNAHVFLTDNLSQDDPFMLYAALYSGLGTCFVSRDLMRGHKFLLADPKLQITFQKWQATHQYFITNIDKNGNVYFQDTVSFLQITQQNCKGDWHVPYFVKEEELTSRDRVDHLHMHWMCMQKKSTLVGASRKPNRMNELNTRPEKIREDHRPTQKSTKKINFKGLFKEDDL